MTSSHQPMRARSYEQPVHNQSRPARHAKEKPTAMARRWAGSVLATMDRRCFSGRRRRGSANLGGLEALGAVFGLIFDRLAVLQRLIPVAFDHRVVDED